MLRRFLPLVLLTGAAPAAAQTLRDLCPERPGLGTPPCIVDAGHLLAELGGVDWTLDRQADGRTDTITAGDLLLRYGLGPSTEVQLHWDGIGHVRERDRTTGSVMRRTRAGDLSIGIKQSLAHPDGDGFSIALDPAVTLPVGRRPVGAGDWGALLRVPVSYTLSEAVTLTATPEIDAAVDEDGDGRHLHYGASGGVGLAVSDAVTLTAEAAAYRDRDSGGHATTAFASLSAGWQPGDDLQLDAGGVAGLNHASPDVELYVGVSRRF